jgi:hypothetical protein
MPNKSLLLIAVVLGLSFSAAKAQDFSTGVFALNGSSILNTGNVVYSANFDGGSNSATIGSVTFTGTNQVDGTYQSGNFSITGAGGLDGTGGGTAGGTAGVVTLNENGLYYQLTLTLNNLTPNQQYAVQLIVDSDAADNRIQAYADTTNPSNVVTSNPVYAGGGGTGPAYITDTFTASGTSEVLAAQYGGGQGSQLSGFVLETAPEPSTWALMGLSLVGLLFLVRRPLARSQA